MTYDKLIFKFFKCNHHDSIFSQVVKVRRLEVSASDCRWDVFNWRRDVVLSKENNAKHIATTKSRYTILFRSKSKFSTLYVQNESNSLNFEFSIDSKIECDVKLLVIEQDLSEMNINAITKTTKAISFKKRNLKKQRNQKWKIKKQQQSKFVSFFDLDSNDSMNIIMIETIFFCWSISKIKNRKWSVFSSSSIKSIRSSKFYMQI